MNNNRQVSYVKIHDEQFDMFVKKEELAMDKYSPEFSEFIADEVIDRSIDSKYWLKHLRDCYAKVTSHQILLLFLLVSHFYI